MAGRWIKGPNGETQWQGDQMPTPQDYLEGGFAPGADASGNHPMLNGAGGQLNFGGLPALPQYTSIDPRSYSIGEKTRSDLAGINTDMSGLKAYRDEAMRTGPSRGSMLAMEKVGQDEQTGRNRVGMETAGRAAEARSNLAMRGGLSSGARERVAKDAVRAGVSTSQDVGRQAADNRMQIGINDEGNRLNMLSGLGAQQNTYNQTDLDKARIQATAGAQDARNYMDATKDANAWKRDIWGQQMEGWAANRTANATENSGKK